MPKLLDKIFAIEAAAAISNSMGDVTETYTYTQLDEKFGYVTQMLPQEKAEKFRKPLLGPVLHYKAHRRVPGMTEDGQERHRLVTTAIIEKGGRITVEDLARVWVRDIRPEFFGYLLGPQDQVIYYSLMAGIPPSEVGRYAAWPGFIGTAKMIAPIGVVNAGNPDQAALDAYDVGRLKDIRYQTGNYALEVAAGLAAGVAEALKPASRVETVIATVLSQLSETPRKEVESWLECAQRCRGDWMELRPMFQKQYEFTPMSNAVEVIAGALSIFSLTGPDPKEVILHLVNFGRDTDCKAYCGSVLAAAMAGPAGIPVEWIETIENELPTDPYTVSRRSLKDTAAGLYQAVLGNLNRMKAQIATVEDSL